MRRSLCIIDVRGLEVLDSRNSEIGCIKNDDIIGKIVFKIWDSKQN